MDIDLTSVKQSLITESAVDVSDLDRVVRFAARGAHLDVVLLRIANGRTWMVVRTVGWERLLSIWRRRRKRRRRKWW
jgi:hypothetical protein